MPVGFLLMPTLFAAARARMQAAGQGICDELLRQRRIAPLYPYDAQLLQPDHHHQHGEEPRQEVITRDGGRVEQGDGVLDERRRADQPQPRIELAAAKDDVNEYGHTGGIQRNGREGFRGATQPVRDLPNEASQKLAMNIETEDFARSGGIGRGRHDEHIGMLGIRAEQHKHVAEDPVVQGHEKDRHDSNAQADEARPLP